MPDRLRGRLRLALGVALFATVGAAPAAQAQPGDLDPTFARHGYLRTAFGDPSARATDVAIDDQGRIVAAGVSGDHGFFLGPPKRAAIAVVRLTPDGELDPSFSGDGRATVELGAPASTAGVAITAGDGIVVGASGGGDMHALRLLADGVPDTSFAGDGIATANLGADEQTAALALRPDGGLYLGGRTCTAPATCSFALASFAADGALDPAFSGDGLQTTAFVDEYSAVGSLALYGDGRLLAAGFDGNSFNGYTTAVARYEPDGDLDPTYNGGGRAVISENTHGGADVALDSAGRLVALGGTGAVFRLLEDASLDPTFTRGGLPADGMALDGESRIVGAGYVGGSVRFGYEPVDMAVGRLEADGARDPQFGSGAPPLALADTAGKDDAALDVTIDAGGRIVAAGWSGDKLVIARFRVDQGPADADADGFGDAKDRCRLRYARGHRGCPKNKRKLTLKLHDGRWSGRVRSRDKHCSSREQVEVLRRWRGPDRVVAETRSGADGRWDVKARSAAGTYYAAVERTSSDRVGICGRARSKKVEIGR